VVTLHGIIQMEVLSLNLSHSEEMIKVKDTLIANLKKTICKLEEEKHENATKIMKRRKKTNMWCFVGTFVFFVFLLYSWSIQKDNIYEQGN
jgi:hypothetical protein